MARYILNLEFDSLQELQAFMAPSAAITPETTEVTVTEPAAEPTKKKAARKRVSKKKAAEERSESDQSSDQPSVTRDDLHKLAIELCDTCGREKIKDVLSSHGVEKIRDMPDDKIEAVHQDLLGLKQ